MGTISAESRAKFEANFIAEYQPLMAHAKSKLRHIQDAEDLVSRTALKAWRAWPTYKDDNFAGWIHRILANEITDFHRANQRIPQGYNPDHVPERAASGDQESRHELRDAERAIGGLSPIQRTTLLRTVAGDSDVQIAADLHVARKTVRVNIHKARKNLRRAAAV